MNILFRYANPAQFMRLSGVLLPYTAIAATALIGMGLYHLDFWDDVRSVHIRLGIALMLGGVILSLAASPPVAARIGLDPFYFVNRHIMYLIPAAILMLTVSLMSPRQIRRSALIVFAISFVGVNA